MEANEDCLQLNVFRPARASKRALPVLFYIHGGGFSYGSGRWHDGALLAKENGIVVVTINYRLGAFGFLNLPGLSRSGAGNYGAAGFNGSAAMGEPEHRRVRRGPTASHHRRPLRGRALRARSASPRTKGLFDGAVIQSAGCPSHTVAESTARGRAFAEVAGCAEPDTAVACLRAKDGETLLHSSRGFVGGILSGPLPTAGVPELPLAPDKAVRSGRFNNVPIMIGSTRDEVRQWAAPFADATPEQYEAALRATYGEHAPEVLAHYPLDPEDGRYAAAYALGAAWTDSSVFYGLGGCEYAELALNLRPAATPHVHVPLRRPDRASGCSVARLRFRRATRERLGLHLAFKHRPERPAEAASAGDRPVSRRVREVRQAPGAGTGQLAFVPYGAGDVATPRRQRDQSRGSSTPITIAGCGVRSTTRGCPSTRGSWRSRLARRTPDEIRRGELVSIGSNRTPGSGPGPR